MKTTFKINDDHFADYLRLTYGDKQVCFAEETTIEYEPCDELEVSIEEISTNEYIKYKIKSPILSSIICGFLTILGKLFVIGFWGLLFMILHDAPLMDKDEITDFESFSPFENVKVRFKILNPNDKTVELKYTPARFRKGKKFYFKPSINIVNEDISVLENTATFSYKKLRNRVASGLFPISIVLIVFLGILIYACSAFMINNFSISSIRFWAMSPVIVGILVILWLFLRSVNKTFKKCKLIAQNQMETE